MVAPRAPIWAYIVLELELISTKHEAFDMGCSTSWYNVHISLSSVYTYSCLYNYKPDCLGCPASSGLVLQPRRIACVQCKVPSRRVPTPSCPRFRRARSFQACFLASPLLRCCLGLNWVLAASLLASASIVVRSSKDSEWSGVGCLPCPRRWNSSGAWIWAWLLWEAWRYGTECTECIECTDRVYRVRVYCLVGNREAGSRLRYVSKQKGDPGCSRMWTKGRHWRWCHQFWCWQTQPWALRTGPWASLEWEFVCIGRKSHLNQQSHK